jgi:hypothetical protein
MRFGLTRAVSNLLPYFIMNQLAFILANNMYYVRDPNNKRDLVDQLIQIG